MLKSIRDNDVRAEFMGYNVANYRIFVFCVSAFMAAAAGALYAAWVGIVSFLDAGPVFSIEGVIWTAVGGRGTLIGPFIGAFLVKGAEFFLSGVLASMVADHCRRPVHLRRAGAARRHRRLDRQLDARAKEGSDAAPGHGRIGSARRTTAARMASRRRAGHRWTKPYREPRPCANRGRRRMANLLEVKGLTTRVSGFTILNNLDFSIEENELRVLLGPNGAGKTTLICMITGQFRPVAGSIHFAGRDITGWAPDDIFQAGISRKFQVPNMYETLSVFDNIMVSLQGRRRVFATLFQRLSGEERDRIWEILEFVELADKASDPADSLSHGERQWLELGMLIASNPKLFASRRADHRHDRGRQAQDGGTDPQDRQNAYRAVGRARYAHCPSDRATYHRSASGPDCWLRGRSAR